MTCVWDSLLRKLPTDRKHNVNSIHDVLNTIKVYAKNAYLPYNLSVNGVFLTNKMREEAREHIKNITIENGYLQSTFDYMYMYACAAFNVNITHRWSTGVARLNINYRIPGIGKPTLCFTSNMHHTS